MKTTRLLPWILFLSGALIYVIGLWQACPLLSGKGYFLGRANDRDVCGVCLSACSESQSERRTLRLCMSMVTLITAGLLLVGVWNAPLSPLEKGLYPVAFIVCLLGQVLLLRLTNDGGLTHQPARIDTLQQYGQQ